LFHSDEDQAKVKGITYEDLLSIEQRIENQALHCKRRGFDGRSHWPAPSL